MNNIHIFYRETPFYGRFAEDAFKILTAKYPTQFSYPKRDVNNNVCIGLNEGALPELRYRYKIDENECIALSVLIRNTKIIVSENQKELPLAFGSGLLKPLHHGCVYTKPFIAAFFSATLLNIEEITKPYDDRCGIKLFGVAEPVLVKCDNIDDCWEGLRMMEKILISRHLNQPEIITDADKKTNGFKLAVGTIYDPLRAEAIRMLCLKLEEKMRIEYTAQANRIAIDLTPFRLMFDNADREIISQKLIDEDDSIGNFIVWDPNTSENLLKCIARYENDILSLGPWEKNPSMLLF